MENCSNPMGTFSNQGRQREERDGLSNYHIGPDCAGRAYLQQLFLLFSASTPNPETVCDGLTYRKMSNNAYDTRQDQIFIASV